MQSMRVGGEKARTKTEREIEREWRSNKDIVQQRIKKDRLIKEVEESYKEAWTKTLRIKERERKRVRKIDKRTNIEMKQSNRVIKLNCKREKK
jgi:hypothetical protein